MVKKDVLFIGNSLTYYNGMPDYLKAMLVLTNQPVTVETSTYPGMTLDAHLDNVIESKTENGITTRKKRNDEQTETEKKIFSKKWDIVILQEATVQVLIPEFRKFNTEAAIEKIKKLVDNPVCTFILFKTWAPNGTFPVQYCYPAYLLHLPIEKENCCSVKFSSLEEEFRALSADYD